MRGYLVAVEDKGNSSPWGGKLALLCSGCVTADEQLTGNPNIDQASEHGQTNCSRCNKEIIDICLICEKVTDERSVTTIDESGKICASCVAKEYVNSPFF